MSESTRLLSEPMIAYIVIKRFKDSGERIAGMFAKRESAEVFKKHIEKHKTSTDEMVLIEAWRVRN